MKFFYCTFKKTDLDVDFGFFYNNEEEQSMKWDVQQASMAI